MLRALRALVRGTVPWLVCGALALAGCQTPGVPPATWTTSVCGALRPWQERITDLNGQTSRAMSAATTPRQTRDNLLRLFGGGRDASEDARRKIVAAGVPRVADGKATADRFGAALAAVRDAYASAYDTVKTLPMTRATPFYDAVAAAVAALNRAYAAANPDVGQLASGPLRDQFAATSACTGH